MEGKKKRASDILLRIHVYRISKFPRQKRARPTPRFRATPRKMNRYTLLPSNNVATYSTPGTSFEHFFSFLINGKKRFFFLSFFVFLFVPRSHDTCARNYNNNNNNNFFLFLYLFCDKHTIIPRETILITHILYARDFFWKNNTGQTRQKKNNE